MHVVHLPRNITYQTLHESAFITTEIILNSTGDTRKNLSFVLHNLRVIRERLITMSKRGTKQIDTNGWQFITLRPDKEQKAEFDSWLADNADVVGQTLDNLLLSAHKITVKFDYMNDTFIVSLTVTDEEDVNVGTSVVIRSGNWVRGLQYLAYWFSQQRAGIRWTKVQDDGIL